MLCFAAPTWGFRVEMKKKAGNSNQTPKQRTAPSQAGRQPSLKKQMEVRPLNEITQDMFTSNSITVSARWTNPAPVCCSLKRALCWFLFWEQQGESTFVTRVQSDQRFKRSSSTVEWGTENCQLLNVALKYTLNSSYDVEEIWMLRRAELRQMRPSLQLRSGRVSALACLPTSCLEPSEVVVFLCVSVCVCLILHLSVSVTSGAGVTSGQPIAAC